MELFCSLIVLVNDTTIGSRELDSMAHNGTEHSLQVEGRADRLTDLTQRFQFADRFRKLLRPRFEFLEEPYILDGDHGLVGEGLQQLDVLFAEWRNDAAP